MTSFCSASVLLHLYVRYHASVLRMVNSLPLHQTPLPSSSGYHSSLTSSRSLRRFLSLLRRRERSRRRRFLRALASLSPCQDRPYRDLLRQIDVNVLHVRTAIEDLHGWICATETCIEVPNLPPTYGFVGWPSCVAFDRISALYDDLAMLSPRSLVPHN